VYAAVCVAVFAVYPKSRACMLQCVLQCVAVCVAVHVAVCIAACVAACVAVCSSVGRGTSSRNNAPDPATHVTCVEFI